MAAEPVTLPYVILGLATEAERRSRAAVSLGVRTADVAAWPARQVWRSPLAGPLRQWTDEASARAAHDGRELASETRRRARTSGGKLLRRFGDDLIDSGFADDLIDWLLDSGALDRLIRFIANHPGTEALIVHVLQDPGVDRLIARAIDSRLIDEVIARLLDTGSLDRAIRFTINHPDTETLVVNVLNDSGMDRLIARAIDSRMVDQLTDRLLESEELQTILDYVTRSPELRAALAHQATGLAVDVADGVRSRTVAADEATERFARGLIRRRRRPESQ